MPTRKWGTEQLVNTTTAGYQTDCSVAALTGGGFVVVWEDSSASDPAIRAQLYDATGMKLGSEKLIYGPTGFDQFGPSVTGLANGGFFVSWQAERSDASDVTGQVYSANGTFIRWQEPVPFFDASVHADGDAAVARLGTGSVAAWFDFTDQVIKARIFDAVGNSILVEPVNTGGVAIQEAEVAGSPDGQAFVVVWQSFSATLDVKARIFDETGAQIAAEFTVNSTLPDAQGTASAAWLNNEQFVVVWDDQQPTPGDIQGFGSIKARIFTGSGTAVTGEILVNSTTPDAQIWSDVTALPNGGFAVAWEDWSKGSPDIDIRLQAFDGVGGKIGGEIIVNTTATDAQRTPSIAALPDGRIVVTWEDFGETGGDTSGGAIRMQIIDPRDGIVTGTSASDTLYGHDLVNDEITGFAGSDLLIGMKGDDGLYGGEGNDRLRGGLGADNHDGGLGTDSADYIDSTAAVTVNLTTGVASGGFAAGDSFIGIESVIGSAFADTMTGKSGANTLNGAAGADIMRGLAGGDTYVVDNTGDVVDESATGSGGVDLVQSSRTFSLADAAHAKGAIENLTLIGVAAINATGNSLANTLTGNTVANRLFGMNGNDILNGGSGNDTLTGGFNKDAMTGGAGLDDFDFNSVAETGNAATRDVIKDFVHLSDDIDLSTIDANGGAAGNTAFSFLALEGAAFTGARGQLRWFQQDLTGTASDKTIVAGDVNGDSVADFQIELTGLQTLTAGDFFL